MIKINSIKTRIVSYYFIAILLTVSILEGLLLISIKDYYYNGIESILKDQVKMASRFYSKYLNSSDVQKIAEDLTENFFYNMDVDLQILDKENRVIWDALGVPPGTKIETEDTKKSLGGEIGKWIGKDESRYTSEKIMAISAPLIADKVIVGSIRVITSMEPLESLLNKIRMLLILIGVVVMVITTLLSVLISNSIIKPLEQVTETAKTMARGEFKVKAEKKYDDEVGSMADTLNYMSEQILKSERLKNDFISSISHELKTPLTSIKGWAMTLKLKEFKDPIQREKGLDIIVGESERLTALVEELLDFSKFESSKITLNIENISINTLLEDIVIQMEPRAVRNNINLVYGGEELPLIKGDKNRLKQVFINIIDNALKFTEDGGEVYIKTFNHNDYINIIISDNGIGIKEEDLSHVKEKFYKGESKKSGSGIGLAVCEDILNLHEGSLEINSIYGKGTEVKITLRIDK